MTKNRQFCFYQQTKTVSLRTTESCWQKKFYSNLSRHHYSRSFTHALDDALSSAVILNGGKNTLWESREKEWWNGVKNLLLEWHLTAFLTTIIDPSLPLRMTSYCFPQHVSRSFATASDNVLPPLSPRQQTFNHILDDDFPSAVILNGGKNALWEKRETEWWNRVKNLLLG